MGPDVYLTTKIQKYEEIKSKIENIASIYYLLLGQGSSYNQGLYGPFPFFDFFFDRLPCTEPFLRRRLHLSEHLGMCAG